MTDWTGNGATFGTETSAIPVLPGPRCSPPARHAGIRQILPIFPLRIPDPASMHPAHQPRPASMPRPAGQQKTQKISHLM